MPYQRLLKMDRFSKIRVKQLFDDARIFIGWMSSIKKGKIIHDRKDGYVITFSEVIKRFANIRGLLWALGYEFKKPLPGASIFYKRLWSKLYPLVKKSFMVYKGRVEKTF